MRESRLDAAGVGGRYGVGSGHVGTEYCFENERRRKLRSKK